MRILLTAFDPFGGESINPALEAVKLVRDKQGIELIKLEVPTVFGISIETVYKSMSQNRPDAVLCVGQAAGRRAITPERVAINVCDASIADNAGQKPVDVPIYIDGPDAYFSTLPIKTMVKAAAEEGVEAAVSNSAGTFVCNQLMYGVLYHIAHEFPGMLGGFVHVPCVPGQMDKHSGGGPSMALADIVRGLEAMISAIDV